MNRRIILLLALTLIVSGCIDAEESEESEQSVTCSSMHLRVIDADGGQAEVANMGRDSFGNVTVTWNYFNEASIVKEFETPEGGETVTFESGVDSRLQGLSVQHQDCPSRTASY